MPKVIGIIIGIGEIALGILGLALIGPGAFGLILLGASTVLSGVSSLLTKKPIGSRGSPLTSRQPMAPWDIVYGRAHKGGTITYLNTTGSNNEYLQMVITLSGNQLTSIDAIYFDGLKLTFSGSA